MKISMLVPKNELTLQQQKRLEKLGNVVYTKSRDEYPLDELIELCKESIVIGLDPDNLGGFDKAPSRFVSLVEALQHIKGIALITTSYGYIDLDYCQKRGLVVTNVPHYATEAIAEHALAYLLGCSKRIFIADRKTREDNFELLQGFELKNKILGVVGLGDIGTRTTELGNAVGMKVIGWNRSSKQVSKVEIKTSLDELLEEADAIVLAVADNKETIDLLSKTRIKKLKKGAIVVNIASRAIVDEEAMATALRNGDIDSYVVESNNPTMPPLGQIDNAFVFKQFGWYTKEAMDRNLDVWISNIEGIINGTPVNPVF